MVGRDLSIVDGGMVPRDSKDAWVSDIARKLMHNRRLEPKDLSFLQSMCSSDNNAAYGELLKSMSMAVLQHDAMGELKDPESLLDVLHKNILLQTQLFKATSQQRRDSAVERSQNLNAFNKMSQMLSKKDLAKSFSGHDSSAVVDDNSVPINVHDSNSSVDERVIKRVSGDDLDGD